MYTIRQAAAQSGLSVPVVRAWERRYGVVHPTRTAAGYRLYDEAAIDRLRHMRALVDRGWSPSAAAAALVAGTAPAVDIGQRTQTERRDDDVPSPGGEERTTELREAFIDSAAKLDAAGVERALDEMFGAGSFEVVAQRDVLPALEALGDAWAAGRVDVAGEHAASHAVGRRLAGLYQAAASPSPTVGSILVGMHPSARHELGALAFAVAARRAGLPVLYLGADLPIVDWVAAARRARAWAAVIGAVTRSDGEAAMAMVRSWVHPPTG
jgi:MerR family transcriptional regulator, light-induced transcriptional regulator